MGMAILHGDMLSWCKRGLMQEDKENKTRARN